MGILTNLFGRWRRNRDEPLGAPPREPVPPLPPPEPATEPTPVPVAPGEVTPDWDGPGVEELLSRFDDIGPSEAGGDPLADIPPEAVEGLFAGLELDSQPPEREASGGPEDAPGGGEPVDGDEVPENREMFEGIAGAYVRPVRQFLELLARGPVSKEWLGVCRPAVGMVARSARSLGLGSVAAPLEAFEEALGQAAQEEGASVDGAAREGLLEAARPVTAALPDAFGRADATELRDGAILPSFLRQIPEVGKVTLDKIFGAGLTSLEVLERASASELAVTTGIPLRLSERICAAVTEYGVESRRRLADTSPDGWLRLVTTWTNALETHDAAYRELGVLEGDARGAGERKRLRRSRQAAAFKLEMLLAEMGEVQFVDELQRLPFAGRVRHLRQFLSARAAT